MTLQSITFDPRRAIGAVLAWIGYVLSPLSWWNDLFVNVPLAIGFAWPFAALDRRLFMPAFMIGYALTNVIGLMLMHHGVAGAVQPQRLRAHLNWRRDLLVGLGYTAVVAIMIWRGWLPIPAPP